MKIRVRCWKCRFAIPRVNGTTLLRERIAALYPNASTGNVLVTVGAAQANWMVCNTLLEQGDEVIVVSPGYRQVLGLAKNAGYRVKETQLRQFSPIKDLRIAKRPLKKLHRIRSDPRVISSQ